MSPEYPKNIAFDDFFGFVSKGVLATATMQTFSVSGTLADACGWGASVVGAFFLQPTLIEAMQKATHSRLLNLKFMLVI
jgi:hypothetical protein